MMIHYVDSEKRVTSSESKTFSPSAKPSAGEAARESIPRIARLMALAL
jgi:hypothetical protein